MSPKWMASGSPEEMEKRAELERTQRAEERAAWANLYHVYTRCVEIAEKVWEGKLAVAKLDQQQLAETMRDRSAQIALTVPENTLDVVDASIPVPLFTPRDRMQFIKEVGATLLISADKRNLMVRFPKERLPDAEAKPEAPEGLTVEATPGVVEGDLDTEAGQAAASGAPLGLAWRRIQPYTDGGGAFLATLTRSLGF